jgi:hypothetical protein
MFATSKPGLKNERASTLRSRNSQHDPTEKAQAGDGKNCRNARRVTSRC